MTTIENMDKVKSGYKSEVIKIKFCLRFLSGILISSIIEDKFLGTINYFGHFLFLWNLVNL